MRKTIRNRHFIMYMLIEDKLGESFLQSCLITSFIHQTLPIIATVWSSANTENIAHISFCTTDLLVIDINPSYNILTSEII